MSDSENEDGEAKPKRAKITDTDNEDEDNKDIGEEGVAAENVPREGGGGSSDEGVMNEDGENKGFVSTNLLVIKFSDVNCNSLSLAANSCPISKLCWHASESKHQRDESVVTLTSSTITTTSLINSSRI